MFALNAIVLILLIAGGLNWGLVGLANFNLVERIFVAVPVVAKIVYILVGLAAIYAAVFFQHYVHHAEWHRESTYGHTPHPT